MSRVAQRSSREAIQAATIGLKDLITGKRYRPDRAMIMGTEGVGKTTFGANAPKPVFIAAEDGCNHVDVARWLPESYEEVVQCLRVLFSEEHDFETLVIDTVDWLEPMIEASVCAKAGWETIADGKFGAGYVAMETEWRKFLHILDKLRAKREMQIVLLAHVRLKVQENPNGPDVVRYEPAMKRRTIDILKAWVDTLLYCEYERHIDPETKKAFSTGRRVMHSKWEGGFDAKCRWGIPATLELGWDHYEAARNAALEG